MAVLAGGGVLCAVATAALGGHAVLALILAVIGYSMVGLGVGAAGTSLLVLMAKRVDDRRRAAAATIMWILMIAGFAVTSTLAGHFLDPYSPERLIRVTCVAAAAAFLTALAAIWKVESGGRDLSLAAGAARAERGAAGESGAAKLGAAAPGNATRRDGSFAAALRTAWADREARGFALFVFVSMLAYSAQELLLEPFSGLVFGYTLGDSARLSGSWHAAALVGMICVGLACSGARRFGSLRHWTIGGCCASAAAMLALAGASVVGRGWPLQASVMALGVANGVFAVSAIGSMMDLGARGDAGSAGVRMGLWGAAQAVAFALGGVFGTAIVDACRWLFGLPTAAFAIVFSIEAALFFAAARLAAGFDSKAHRLSTTKTTAVIA
jgi:BCD family chlorophyll transporter-like MFS transporter